MKATTQFGVFSAVFLALAVPSGFAQTIISADSFTMTGSRQPVDGTTLGLSVNQPGGNWIRGAGWFWGAPMIPATWDGAQEGGAGINLAEEKTALGLSIASTGGYVKPSVMTATAQLKSIGGPTGAMGLGFWSAIDPIDLENVADTTHSKNNFTGILVTNSATGGNFDDLIFVLNGVNQTSVSLGIDVLKDQAYTLSYTIHTVSGNFSDVTFEGNAVALTGTGFTDANTAYFGVMSDSSARAWLGSLSLTAVPEPGNLALVLAGLGVLGLARNRRGSRMESRVSGRL